MRYIKTYERYILKESVGKRKLILFSGPSASGKSYLAEDLGAKHWYEGNSSVVLVGTDNFGGDSNKTFSKFSKLLKEFGCPELSKFKKDWHWLIELYKEDYKKWKEAASDEEKKKYEELKSKLSFEKSQDESKNFPHHHKDGRICGMAWTAHLLPESVTTIIFDDISTGIENYFKVQDILAFTPLDWMMKNIKSREIDVNEEGTSLYQYCDWFMATDKQDLDNKMYTSESLINLLSDLGHNKPNDILQRLGVNGKLDNGFYITTRPDVPDVIVNTRDESSGRAISVSSLSL